MDLQHYKFFFNSVTDDSEKYILLDVAYESNKYPRVIEKKIQNKKLNIESNLSVKVPSIVTYFDVLEDIEDFTKDIIFMKDKTKLEKISICMGKIASFRLERKFLIDKEVLLAASKVLYLTALIKNNTNVIEKYKGNIEFEDVDIPEEYKKRLKVIRKMNIEAYYYILKTM